MHRKSILLATGSLVLLCAATPLYAANHKGTKMLITATATFAPQHLKGGMTATLHPITETNEKCMPASINDYDEMIRGELARNCKVISYKQAGNTVRYHTRCTKPYHIDRTGTFTQLGNGNITGSEHAEGTNAGHHMSVHFTFAGVPTGRCEYKPSTK